MYNHAAPHREVMRRNPMVAVVDPTVATVDTGAAATTSSW
jgi:hypothetical protein